MPSKTIASKPTLPFFGILLGFLVLLSQPVGAKAEKKTGTDLPQTPVFQQKWEDGNFEVNGYDLTTPELGDLRKGKSLLIFGLESRENFSLLENTFFQVGFHTQHFFGDYDFQASRLGQGTQLTLNAHALTQNFWMKVTPNEKTLQIESILPLQKETFKTQMIPLKDDVIFEDGLFILVRQLRGQEFSPGMEKSFRMVPSLRRLTVGNAKPGYEDVKMTRSPLDRIEKIKVPAGEFQVEKWIVEFANKQTLDIWTETTYPNRIIAWRRSTGEHAELMGFKRMPVRQLTKLGDEKLLIDMGQ